MHPEKFRGKETEERMGQQSSAKVVWTGAGLDFKCVVGSGYQFDVSGGAEKIGGGPMEFLLAGLAGCTAVDMVLILQKQRQEVVGIEVEAQGIRADDHPKVYTDVALTYVVRGKNIDPQAVERAMTLSEEKYCSASAMFSRSGAMITTTYRIEELEEV